MKCDSFIQALATACAFALFLFPATARSAITEPGLVFIGMGKPDVQFDRPTSGRGAEDLVTRTVVELLPDYVVRGLERGLERRIVVVPSFDTATFLGRERQSLGAIVENQILSAPGLGVRVSTKISTRVRKEPDRSQWVVLEASENFLLSPTTSFGELESRMTEHGDRVAKRLIWLLASSASAKTQAPRGIVQFLCVQTSNPDDRRLASLSRRLTVELPFVLTEVSRRRGLELFVRGLEYREAFTLCENPSRGWSNASDAKSEPRGVESQVWDGAIIFDRNRPTSAQLSIRVADRFAGSYRRLAQVPIDNLENPRLPEIAERIVDAILAEYRTR